MKKLKITNPKLLSFILANAIFLSQTGCSKQEVLSTAKVEKTQKTSLDNPSKLRQV